MKLLRSTNKSFQYLVLKALIELLNYIVPDKGGYEIVKIIEEIRQELTPCSENNMSANEKSTIELTHDEKMRIMELALYDMRIDKTEQAKCKVCGEPYTGEDYKQIYKDIITLLKDK